MADFRKSAHVTGIRIIQQVSTNTAILLAGESYRFSKPFFPICRVGSSENFKVGLATSSSSDEPEAEFSRNSAAISGSSFSSSSLEDSEKLDSLILSSSGDVLPSSGGVLAFGMTLVGCVAPCVSCRWKYGSAGGGFGRRLKCSVHISLHIICPM